MKKLLIAAGCLGLVLGGQLLLAQGKGKGKAAPGNAQAGKELFEANCSVCHNADSTERKMGPGLKGLFMHEKLVNGQPVNDANVQSFIEMGGNGMPGFADLLVPAEKADLIAYLKSL
jgi:cytochrome c